MHTMLPASFAPPAPAVAPRHSESKLRRLHADCLDALPRSDADWLERHLASDFRAILADGRRVGRATVLAGGHAAEAAADGTEVQFEGDVALVQWLAASADGAGAPRERRSDLWIGRDGRWQLLATQATALAG